MTAVLVLDLVDQLTLLGMHKNKEIRFISITVGAQAIEFV